MLNETEELAVTRDRVLLCGVAIDRCTLPMAVQRLWQFIREPARCCRYVVTPNVDHFVLLQESARLRAVYAEADLVTADGMPVVWASKLLGCPLPERVTGADLVPALLASASSEVPLRVFLLGAAAGVAERAAANIGRQWPHVAVVGTYSPPLGFERDAHENGRILEQIAIARPDVLILGFGAPKQEFWIHEHRGRVAAAVALCAGATIDFLAGEKRRAPVWMGRLGLEWVFRLLSEPRRLCQRYYRDARVFPRLVWREWRLRRPAAVP